MIGLSLFEYEKMSNEDWQIVSKIYCGLCDGLRFKFGVAAGLLISDEAQFLAVLTAAQREKPILLSTTKCPLKGYLAENPIVGDKPAFQYAAIITMLLLGEKLEDGIRDDNNISSKLGRKLLDRTINKAYEDIEEFGFLQSKLEKARELQAKVESLKGKSLEWYLNPTSMIVGEIFSHTAIIARNTNNLLALRQLGESVGNLVNLIDSCEDFNKDSINNSFNPIISSFQPDNPVSTSVFINVCYFAIHELYRIRSELLNLELSDFNSMIENVLTRGLANRLLWALAQFWKNNHWKGNLPLPENWNSEFQRFVCKVCKHPHKIDGRKHPLDRQIMLFPRNLWVVASYYPNIEQVAKEFGYSDPKNYIFSSIFPMILAENLENRDTWSIVSKRFKILRDQTASTPLASSSTIS